MFRRAISFRWHLGYSSEGIAMDAEFFLAFLYQTKARLGPDSLRLQLEKCSQRQLKKTPNR
jgi:hypothetical protein